MNALKPKVPAIACQVTSRLLPGATGELRDTRSERKLRLLKLFQQPPRRLLMHRSSSFG
jgi:hypothetical protein